MKTYIRKKVELPCNQCGQIFLKDESEFKRSESKGMKHYCSLRCIGLSSYEHLKQYDNSSNLVSDNRRDEYSGLRVHLSRARSRNKDVTVTLQHLKEVWDRQHGRCIYSGVELVHPIKNELADPIRTSSLDRIDSSFGYVDGNVQFISVAMNHMKGTMTHQQTIELINIIKQSYVTTSTESSR